LERDLRGEEIAKNIITNRIRDFYKKHGIEAPGMTAEDVADAIIAASSKSNM
jgi:hypothetical protein